LAAEWMVNEEDRLLKTLRQVTFTDGVATALASGNSEHLRELVLPIVITNHEDVVDILDLNGTSVISLQHPANAAVAEYTVTKGETAFVAWASVKQVLTAQSDKRGDKYAEVVQASWGNYFYIAGPIFNSQARLVGVVLIGKSLPRLASEMQQSTLAYASLYDQQGHPLASSLPLTITTLPSLESSAAQILAAGSQSSEIRPLSVGASQYTEIVGPWQARGAVMGLLGTTLAPGYLTQASTLTQVQAFAVALAAFLLIIVIGVFLAAQITRPLRHMVATTAQVAQGNLEVKINAQGSDEVAALGHAFNYMVAGLQEGNVYRDLLGRAVSPEVRDELRMSFSSGDLRLEGQSTTATVLMSDIRGFTTLSEKQEPTTVLRWLNEYFSELVPVITAHGGVVDKFEGDAILAFFGVLPRMLPAQQSALQACQAALAMMDKINHINASRQERGDPLFITGIGINTGVVTAGGLGTADRLNYTIIGDTVNTTQRLESFTREFGATGTAVSETTHDALDQKLTEFQFEPMGKHRFKGKSDEIAV
jgi:class 3 adenylate cyclase